MLLHAGSVHGDGAPEDVLDAAAMATVFGVQSGAATGFFPRAFRVDVDG